MGLSTVNHHFWDTPIYGICIYIYNWTKVLLCHLRLAETSEIFAKHRSDSCSTWKVVAPALTSSWSLVFEDTWCPLIPIYIPMSHKILGFQHQQQVTKIPLSFFSGARPPPRSMAGCASQRDRRKWFRVASQRSGGFGRLRLPLICFAVGSMQVGNRRHNSELHRNRSK